MSLQPLTFLETRLIGCLIEKSLTTPELYPLSLNALTNDCNQKSNREPVLNLIDAEVQDVADSLVSAGLMNAQSGFGSRVIKYKHRFCNTEFGELKLTAQELGVVCVLFLRGPQTPGELRTRTNRLCTFNSLDDVETVLSSMANKGWVKKLEREPGKREARYAHLFAGEEGLEPVSSSKVGSDFTTAGSMDDSTSSDLAQRVVELEQQLGELQERIERLESYLE